MMKHGASALVISMTITVAAISGLWATAGQADPTKQVEIISKEFSFSPEQIKVEAGRPLELTLDNAGALAHNISFTNKAVATETIQGGDKTTVTVTFDEPGRYEFVCSVPGHANAGMKGVVVVE